MADRPDSKASKRPARSTPLPSKKIPKPSRAVINKLTWFFDRNGYVRRRTIETISLHGQKSLRQADELRLTANTQEEIVIISRLLEHAGFKPSRPFVKKRQLRIPVYGRRAVDRFLELIGRSEPLPRGLKPLAPTLGSQALTSD